MFHPKTRFLNAPWLVLLTVHSLPARNMPSTSWGKRATRWGCTCWGGAARTSTTSWWLWRVWKAQRYSQLGIPSRNLLPGIPGDVFLSWSLVEGIGFFLQPFVLSLQIGLIRSRTAPFLPLKLCRNMIKMKHFKLLTQRISHFTLPWAWCSFPGAFLGTDFIPWMDLNPMDFIPTLASAGSLQLTWWLGKIFKVLTQ